MTLGNWKGWEGFEDAFLRDQARGCDHARAHHDGLCKGQNHVGITSALGPSSESDLGSLSSPPSSVPEDRRFLLLLLLSWLVTGAKGDISKELRDTVSTALMVRAWKKMEERVF